MKKLLATLSAAAMVWMSSMPASASLSGSAADVRVLGAGVSNTNPLIVGSQNTTDVTGSISSATSSTQINLFGSSCVQVTVPASGFSATINVQAAADSANPSWSNIKDASGGSAYTTGFTRVACSPGSGAMRLNVTPYTSGTITYTLHLIPQTATNVSLTATGGNSASIGGYTTNYTTSNFGLNTISNSLAYNGSSFDAIRKDSYTAGPLWMSAGGASTTAIAAATSGPTVIKASAGRLARILVTAGGATTPETIYDNSSACSGTIIGIVPTTATDSTAVAGRVYSLDVPAAAGITACGGTGSPAVTVSNY